MSPKAFCSSSHTSPSNFAAIAHRKMCSSREPKLCEPVSGTVEDILHSGYLRRTKVAKHSHRAGSSFVAGEHDHVSSKPKKQRLIMSNGPSKSERERATRIEQERCLTTRCLLRTEIANPDCFSPGAATHLWQYGMTNTPSISHSLNPCEHPLRRCQIERGAKAQFWSF